MHFSPGSKCKADHEACPDFRKEADHFCKQDWIKKNCKKMCGLGCGNREYISIFASALMKKKLRGEKEETTTKGARLNHIQIQI